MRHDSKLGDSMGAQAIRGCGVSGRIGAEGHWSVECFDKYGNLKWVDTFKNLVTNEGLDHLLDVALSGATQVSTWYVGLTDGTPTTAAGDTLASHAGWSEVTAYDEAARQTWSDGGVSSQNVDNSASKASFTISTNSTTVGGAFLASDSTKGGTTGTLYAVGAFSAGDKSLDASDTLQVTATFTTAAASCPLSSTSTTITGSS